MKNREWLSSQNEYDLLCRINERANPKTCVLYLLGDKCHECNKYTCESYEHGCRNNCKEEYKCCNNCIQSWLNEERQ